MEKSYKVAGHIFNFSMRESCSLWNNMTPYVPFEMESVSADPVFTLNFMEDAPAPGLGELLFEPECEEGETKIKVFRSTVGWQFEVRCTPESPVSSILVANESFTLGDVYVVGRSCVNATFGINNALMLMYAFRTITMGTLEVHASMVGNSGRAFLFMAKSGTGKSTHSSLWLENVPGTELMNDDNPIVRVLEDGTVMAYGSPWSGKTPCYRNVEAPVGAFVRIRRNSENKITSLPMLEAYALLYSSSSGLKFEKRMADGLHETLSKILATTPCYVLDCRPDAQAAQICSQEVLGDGKQVG